MEWMLDIQLGRRNLSPIQRIAVAEKYRPIYEKQAKENQSKAGKEYGNGGTKLTVNLPQPLNEEKKERNPTIDSKLASIAGVSEKTYRMGAKVLHSDNNELKQRVLSGDMTIISGHQRVRAAKEIGLTLVPIKIDEDLQDEDSKLRALISNNFGRRKNDPSKDRKALETYVTLRGYKQGGDRKSKCQNGTLITLDEIAKELNTSKRNLQRALRIERNLTDSMKELLDSGEISKTLAADTIASMSEEEQEDL